MSENAVVRARVSEKVKQEAAEVLGRWVYPCPISCA